MVVNGMQVLVVKQPGMDRILEYAHKNSCQWDESSFAPCVINLRRRDFGWCLYQRNTRMTL